MCATPPLSKIKLRTRQKNNNITISTTSSNEILSVTMKNAWFGQNHHTKPASLIAMHWQHDSENDNTWSLRLLVWRLELCRICLWCPCGDPQTFDDFSCVETRCCVSPDTRWFQSTSKSKALFGHYCRDKRWRCDIAGSGMRVWPWTCCIFHFKVDIFKRVRVMLQWGIYYWPQVSGSSDQAAPPPGDHATGFWQLFP